MSFEDSEKTSRVTLQQHYNFVMNQVVSITYDLWHIIFMKILLIEDNQRTQEWVTQGLSEAGYVIDAVSDGRDGLYLALKDDYALIILDIMLPEEDGLSILKKIRIRPDVRKLPVIMLTAKGSEFDTVVGLDSGADDYIPKPFRMMELISRIRALLRRTEDDGAEEYRTGNLYVCPSRHIATVDKKNVNLTLKEYEVLCLLLKNSGTVLSRTQLLNQVWGYEFDGESRTVDVHIRTLRQKLGSAGELVETVRGVGYKINMK